MIQPLRFAHCLFWLGGVHGPHAPSCNMWGCSWAEKTISAGFSFQNRTTVSFRAVCSVKGFCIGLALGTGLVSFSSVLLYGDPWAFCLCELLAAWWRIWHAGVAAFQSCYALHQNVKRQTSEVLRHTQTQCINIIIRQHVHTALSQKSQTASLILIASLSAIFFHLIFNDWL